MLFPSTAPGSRLTQFRADFYLAIYFQAVNDDSPLMSGVHMLPTTLGIVLFTMLSGTLSTPGHLVFVAYPPKCTC
jgi:hypothetical protein